MQHNIFCKYMQEFQKVGFDKLQDKNSGNRNKFKLRQILNHKNLNLRGFTKNILKRNFYTTWPKY